MIKKVLIPLCVFCIFLNLALLGFSNAIESTQTQLLAILNILLLSCVFVPRT